MKNIFNTLAAKNKRVSISLAVVLALITGLIAGFSLKYNATPSDRIERHQSGYSYISPLLECFSNKSDSPENGKLQEKIEDFLLEKIRSKKILSASVYFRDLANGPWIGINEDEKFTPASLLKVPIMITYYKIAESDPSILKKEILIDSSYQGTTIQNIKPTVNLEDNKKYSIEDLIEHMIIESDNHAANLLLANIPYDALNDTYDDLGLVFPTVDKPENYMTVKDYASFFRILYNASYLNKFYSEKALHILSQSRYRGGLAGKLPLEVPIAHKFGERKNGDIDQLHDCGIIYKENKDYLLCVMTRGDNFENLSQTIQDISELVYKNVN